MPDREFLTTAEVAEMLGCSVAEVDSYVRAGRLALVIRGRDRLYRRASVERLWSEQFGHPIGE